MGDSWHVSYYPGPVTITRPLGHRHADEVARNVIADSPRLQVHVRRCRDQSCRDCWQYSVQAR